MKTKVKVTLKRITLIVKELSSENIKDRFTRRRKYHLCASCNGKENATVKYHQSFKK